MHGHRLRAGRHGQGNLRRRYGVKGLSGECSQVGTSFSRHRCLVSCETLVDRAAGADELRVRRSIRIEELLSWWRWRQKISCPPRS